MKHLDELHKEILKTNERVKKFENSLTKKFGKQFSHELIEDHTIGIQNDKVFYSDYMSFWDMFDFTKINIFDFSIFTKEQTETGWIVGTISEDDIEINKSTGSVKTTTSNLLVLEFEDFIYLICDLLVVSLENYLGTKSHKFSDIFLNSKRSTELQEFVKTHYESLM